MPCYTVQLISVKFKVKHLNLLERAAKELGMTYARAGRWVNAGTIRIDLENNTAKAISQSSVNALKMKYSEVALKEAARKKNWNLFKTQKQNEFVLQKF